MAQGTGPRLEQQRRVEEMLDHVGLPTLATERYPHEFSCGQLRRLGFAQAAEVPRADAAEAGHGATPGSAWPGTELCSHPGPRPPATALTHHPHSSGKRPPPKRTCPLATAR